MKTDRNGSQLRVTLDGSIGETTQLFSIPLAGITELVVDMSTVTYINSIGVRHWILWTVKVPLACKVKLENCPFVIVSQASTVLGFVTPNMSIDSFRMPYTCESCHYEGYVSAKRSKDYEYSTPTTPKRTNVPPKLECPKCHKPTFVPDFLFDKTFKFLT